MTEPLRVWVYRYGDLPIIHTSQHAADEAAWNFLVTEHVALPVAEYERMQAEIRAGRERVTELLGAARSVLEDEEDATDGSVVAEIGIGKLTSLRNAVEGR
jgi:hypothetical protein